MWDSFQIHVSKLCKDCALWISLRVTFICDEWNFLDDWIYFIFPFVMYTPKKYKTQIENYSNFTLNLFGWFFQMKVYIMLVYNNNPKNLIYKSNIHVLANLQKKVIFVTDKNMLSPQMFCWIFGLIKNVGFFYLNIYYFHRTDFSMKQGFIICIQESFWQQCCMGIFYKSI